MASKRVVVGRRLTKRILRGMALAVVLYALWWKRRSMPGVVLHIALFQLPRTLLHRLLGICNAPKQLDALSTAIVRGIQWVTLGGVEDARANMHVLSWTDGMRARWMGAKMSKVQKCEEWRVEGVWIAEEWRDIPWGATKDLEKQETLRWEDGEEELVILFFIHGGAYCFGTAELGSAHHYEMIKRFNERNKESRKRLVIFSLEYPLAPENKFPAAIHAAAEAYRWLVEKVGVRRMIIGGDSAGAHATISLMQEIAAMKADGKVHDCEIVGNLLISPWLDSGRNAIKRMASSKWDGFGERKVSFSQNTAIRVDSTNSSSLIQRTPSQLMVQTTVRRTPSQIMLHTTVQRTASQLKLQSPLEDVHCSAESTATALSSRELARSGSSSSIFQLHNHDHHLHRSKASQLVANTTDFISAMGVQFADQVVFGHLPGGTNPLADIPGDSLHVATRGTLLLYGGAEVLREGIERFAEKLRNRKEPVQGLQVSMFEGMPHCFSMMMMDFPLARAYALEAVDVCVNFLQDVCESE